MIRSKQYYFRKSHRWLGVLLGIQFIFWTLGGLYFSWSNMDEIHGDFQKKHAPLLSSNLTMVSPSTILDTIKTRHRIDSIVSIQLIEILGKPYYQIRCISALHDNVNSKHALASMNHLADALTGKLRGPITKEEAIAIARNGFNGPVDLKSVTYLNSTEADHEYREQPLPAYAIRFDHPSKTTVYVAAELGTIQKFRNEKWRIFDFLWMLHTMDYETRDHFGNWLLRFFSIFGLLTVLSGFILFFQTQKFKKISNNNTHKI